MQCYTDITPPTAVTASVAFPFISPSVNNLVVAKSCLLQVFAVKSVVADSESTASRNESVPRSQRRERSQLSKLVLISECEVSGTITSLASVKSQRSRSGGELLLVAIQDAKLSLVEWDPERYSISTVSIHYYEREELQGPPWAPALNQCNSVLTVDPRSRCAALKFGHRSLAILPLNQVGDELAIDDFESELEGPSERRRSSLQLNGEAPPAASPYSASFVLSLLQLDPTLTHPIHLTFLHEYREPTIGILSSRGATSSALLHERKDNVSYTVYTLDLEQQASTPLLSIMGLPYDIHKIVPLPSPVGGALLIGCNELVHVGQAGKANGVAVNSLAKECSSYPLVHSAELGLRLEGCSIAQLGSPGGEVLLVTGSSQLVVVGFKLDGRSVSGLDIHRITESNGGSILTARPSCISPIGTGRIFVGSRDSDAVVLGWSSRSLRQQLRRQSSLKEDASNGVTKDEEEASDFEDDLYLDENDDPGMQQTDSLPAAELGHDLSFKIHDRLINLAPLTDISLVKSSLEHPTDEGNRAWSKLDLIAASGEGRISNLVRLSPTLCPSVKKRFDFAGAARIWAVHAESSAGKVPEVELDHHNVMIISMDAEYGEAVTNAYSLDGEQISPLEDCDFEPEAGPTIEVGSLLGGLRIVQILKNELRSFDGDFGLAQITPLPDGLAVVAASFVDTFVLLLGEDGRLCIFRADDSGDLEELQTGDILASQQWQSGSLFDDVDDTFRLAVDTAEEDLTSVLMFLVTSEGGLQVFRLPNLDNPVYVAPGLGFLPPFLSTEFTVRRSSARGELVEILIADLGDGSHKSAFMILRSKQGDIIIYSPYHIGQGSESATLGFRKIDSHWLPKAPSQEQPEPSNARQPAQLRTLPDFGGHFAVFMTGTSPAFVFKPATSNPKVIDLKVDQVTGLSRVRTTSYTDCIAYPGKYGRLMLATLPLNADFSTGWAVEKLYTAGAIKAFKYHEPSDRFVVATSSKVDFKLPHDEFHPEWESENTEFFPQVDQDVIRLIDPSSWTETDTLALDSYEVVVAMESLFMETSENTHSRSSVIALGTALTKGEDINTQGSIYVLDIIPVVPEPDHPETGRKFKVLARHKDKGAVTAITQVGTEGVLLASHGQKCMVRGLKEDGTLLPIAFMDVQCYISVAKELRGTGLCILGDSVKGMWLAGYTEDPYHLRMFGKSAGKVQVSAAEFLPDGRGLCVVLADAETNIHILRFDPHNPKSLSGQHLLSLSSFHTGFQASKITLLPRTHTSWELYLAQEPTDDDMQVDGQEQPTIQHQVLVTSQSGAISLITPLPVAATGAATDSYRALAALQTYLTSTLPHPLGLSPKAFRNVEVDMSVSGRAMLDGNVLRRWTELGSWKKAEAVVRTGGEGEWEVRALLEGVLGRGLGFL